MRFLKKFFKNIGGNVAITFGIAAVPLVMTVGVAVDYSQASLMQAKMQSAGDSAGLAAAAAETKNDGELTAIVKRYVAKNNPFFDKVKKFDVKAKTLPDGRVEIKIEAKLDTNMMRIIGTEFQTVKSTSIITREFGSVDVALVLDNTGSMAGRKMSTLKKAAADLVNIVHDSKGKDAEVRIGLVPFSDYVNIGMGNRNASWADIPRDSTRREKKTRWRRKVIKKYNCRYKTRYYYRDGVRRSYRYKSCQYKYGPRYRETYWKTYKTTWKGCVGSRNYPWNTRDERTSYKIPGIMDRSCSRALTELTTNKKKVLKEIRNMRDSGATYVPAGLMWGWRVVSDVQPFGKSGAKPGKDGSNQKSIVLMTDGENTVSPTYPDHRGGNKTTADNLTKQICANIKASKEKIIVYTVAFEVRDVATKQMLRSCATSSSHYFDASNSVALTASFKKIAKSLASLRIAQ